MSVHRLTQNGKVRFRVSYYDPDGKRVSIRLSGSITQKRVAEQIDAKIQALAVAVATQTPPDPEIVRWANNVSADLSEKLVAHGLICGVDKLTLSQLCDRFIAHHPGRKPATVVKYHQVKANLVEYPGFGHDIQIRSITRQMAKSWRYWVATESNRRENNRKSLDENTVRRRTGIAKQFFNFAIESKWLDANPFAGLKCCVQSNPDRAYFVSREEIDVALANAPDANWRAIIALSRYGGLRTPSEIYRLTWGDVDLAQGVMTIRASKTEHHSSRGIRRCPIFPELRPFIEDLAHLAKPGLETPLTSQVVKFPGKAKNPTESNLRTRFIKILKLAGVEPWEKLFQNMRATRQTELLNHPYPVKDVCEWLGNSQAVAMKHYAMATKLQHSKAMAEPTGKMPEWVAQLPAHSAAPTKCPTPAMPRTDFLPDALSAYQEETWRDVMTLANLLGNVKVGGTELESVTSTMSTLRSNQLS